MRLFFRAGGDLVPGGGMKLARRWGLLWLAFWGDGKRLGIAISHRSDMLYSARNTDRSLHVGRGWHICFPGWRKAKGSGR